METHLVYTPVNYVLCQNDGLIFSILFILSIHVNYLTASIHLQLKIDCIERAKQFDAINKPKTYQII